MPPSSNTPDDSELLLAVQSVLGITERLSGEDCEYRQDELEYQTILAEDLRFEY